MPCLCTLHRLLLSIASIVALLLGLLVFDVSPPPPWTLAVGKPIPPQGSAEPKRVPRPVARVWQPQTA